MTKEFVTYEQALALKELGFDEPCLLSLSWINGYNTYTEKYNEPNAWISSNVEIKYDFSQFKVDFKDVYHVEIQIPLYQQAFRWFREKYDLPSHIAVYWQPDWNNYSYEWNIVENHKQWNVIEHFKTYEKAESDCLDKLIEICKNDNTSN